MVEYSAMPGPGCTARSLARKVLLGQVSPHTFTPLPGCAAAAGRPAVRPLHDGLHPHGCVRGPDQGRSYHDSWTAILSNLILLLYRSNVGNLPVPVCDQHGLAAGGEEGLLVQPRPRRLRKVSLLQHPRHPGTH